MPTRRVMWAGPDVVDAVELARFTLTAAGALVATYQDEPFRAGLERDGVFTAATGTVTPADGAAFFEALGIAFSCGSFVHVEDVPDDLTGQPPYRATPP